MIDSDNREKILTSNGWTVECLSPFEIRHVDGSFATGLAASIVLQSIIDEEELFTEDELIDRIIENGYESGHPMAHPTYVLGIADLVDDELSNNRELKPDSFLNVARLAKFRHDKFNKKS